MFRRREKRYILVTKDGKHLVKRNLFREKPKSIEKSNKKIAIEVKQVRLAKLVSDYVNKLKSDDGEYILVRNDIIIFKFFREWKFSGKEIVANEKNIEKIIENNWKIFQIIE